jgi:hypothetical protein
MRTSSVIRMDCFRVELSNRNSKSCADSGNRKFLVTKNVAVTFNRCMRNDNRRAIV